ncbi:hypothetical protein IFO70_33325 [Phormidium tenue FACHB-886]|nr:hypothetical protein [Phormidium tenue FACHB-886]
MKSPFSEEELKALTKLFGGSVYLRQQSKLCQSHEIYPCVIQGQESEGFKFNVQNFGGEWIYGEGESSRSPFYETPEDAIAAGEKVVADKLLPEQLEDLEDILSDENI